MLKVNYFLNIKLKHTKEAISISKDSSCKINGVNLLFIMNVLSPENIFGSHNLQFPGVTEEKYTGYQTNQKMFFRGLVDLTERKD